jgi:opacity protein-like surface antigen
MSALWLGRVAASLALFSATIVAVTTGGVNQATAQNQSEWRACSGGDLRVPPQIDRSQVAESFTSRDNTVYDQMGYYQVTNTYITLSDGSRIWHRRTESSYHERANQPYTTSIFDDYFCRPAARSSMRGDTGIPSGMFGGGQLALSCSNVRTREYIAATGALTNEFFDHCTGVGGGINGGYNWLLQSGMLLGIVVDANLPNDEVKHRFGGGTFIGSTVNFSASAQVRAGWNAAPDLLLYGQTGISLSNQRLQINFGGPVTDASQLRSGFTAGFGAEWMLAGNPIRWGTASSLFVDYTHTWWETASLNAPAASPLFNYTWQRESDVVKAGMRIYFGGPIAPPPPSNMPVKAPRLR